MARAASRSSSARGTVVRFQSDSAVIVQAPGGKGELIDVLVVFDPGGQLKLHDAFTIVASPP